MMAIYLAVKPSTKEILKNPYMDHLVLITALNSFVKNIVILK